MGDYIMSIFQGCNFIVPSSYTLQAGGAETGTVVGVQTIDDGTVYNVVEANGSLGFDIEYDFTNIRKVYGAVVRYSYNSSGLAAHGLTIELHNYSGGGSDPSFRAETSVINLFNYMTILIPDTGNYEDGSGNAQLTILHTGNGSPNHNLDVDYVALIGLKSA